MTTLKDALPGSHSDTHLKYFSISYPRDKYTQIEALDLNLSKNF